MTTEWQNTPKTNPENVHILYFDGQLDGKGGWIRCNAKVQLSKRMYAWGENKGTLVAEIVNEEDVQAISGLWVLKRFLGQQAPDIEMGVVRRQAIASQWAAGFQTTSPAADAPFLKMVLVQLIQRKGKPLARMEELVEGNYERFVMKANRSKVSRAEIEMLGAFEAYVFHESGQNIVVTNVQKVGDRWTEPIFHSKDQSVGGQSDRGEVGVTEWLRDFHSPEDDIADEEDSFPSYANPSVALPMLGAAGQTFIGDLADESDNSPDQSLEVDGLQISSQRFASHLSSQRRAPSPQAIISPSPLYLSASSALFISGRSVQDTPLAPIESREPSRQSEVVDQYELQTSSRGGTAYVAGLRNLSGSPRPLGDDARLALDIHLSNRDIWDSRKSASIHNSFSGKPSMPISNSQDAGKSVHNSIHSSLDGRKMTFMHNAVPDSGRSTPQNIHASSGSRGNSIPLNIHTSSGGRGSTPKSIHTSSGDKSRTGDKSRVTVASPAQCIWDETDNQKSSTDNTLNPASDADKDRDVSPPIPQPSVALAHSTEAWTQKLKELTAKSVCELNFAVTVTQYSTTIQEALHDSAGQEVDVFILAPPGGDQRAVSVQHIVNCLLLGNLKAGDSLLNSPLLSLPTVPAEATLLSCADAWHNTPDRCLAVVDSAPKGLNAPATASILGIVTTRHLLDTIAPATARRTMPAVQRPPTPPSPIGSALLNTADSNPRDPIPPTLSLEPPAFQPPQPQPPAFPPPQPPSAPDRSVMVLPALAPEVPPPDSPAPPPVPGTAPTLRCSLMQWQRSSQTQGLTVLLFCLDLVLILLASGPGPWSSEQYGRWHATAALLLCLPLLPEAAARCVSHRLPFPSSSTPDAGSFPCIASSLSSPLARAMYAAFEAFDLVVLFFSIILLPSLSAHSLHPRLSGGGTALAVFRALRIARLLPVIAETWAEAWLQRDGPARAGVESGMEYGQKTRGGGEPVRDGTVVNLDAKAQSCTRDRAAGRGGGGNVGDVEVGWGNGLTAVEPGAGKYGTENSSGAMSAGAGIASPSLNVSVLQNTSVPLNTSITVPNIEQLKPESKLEHGDTGPDASASLSQTVRSPTLMQSEQKPPPPSAGTSMLSPAGSSMLSPAVIETSQNLDEDEDENDEDIDLPLPTHNYQSRTPTRGKYASLTNSGRPLPNHASPTLSPSLTSSLRNVSPSQPPANVFVTGSLVNDHHPSTDLTAGAEGKTWMVKERGTGNGRGSGVIRPPLHPSLPVKPPAARKSSGSMSGESRKSSGGSGKRLGFVSLFPDPA